MGPDMWVPWLTTAMTLQWKFSDSIKVTSQGLSVDKSFFSSVLFILYLPNYNLEISILQAKQEKGLATSFLLFKIYPKFFILLHCPWAEGNTFFNLSVEFSYW